MRTTISHRGTDVKRAIRIANCSGFFGDRDGALAEVAADPSIDVLTGDYLAEVTMFVLAKIRAKRPDAGYAASFLRQLEPALDDIAANGTKVVTNAGGLNPLGLADAVRKLLAERAIELRVAVVDGDDVLDRLDELHAAGHRLEHLRTGAALESWPYRPATANAYLGGWGIARALEAGADIVVTGRVTDASVVVGPAAWWHGWSRDEWDRLAGAVVAGHLIECGAQVTGGNYSGFTLLGDAATLGRPAFPVAAVDADGSSTISPAGAGGAVTRGTVIAQLLYEIGSPAYANPDVVAHFDTVQLYETADGVRVHGATGSAPPPTTKVAITAVGGHRNSFTTIVTGLDIDAKTAWFEAAVRRAVDGIGGIDEIVFERLGTAADDPASQGEASIVLRTTVSGEAEAVGRPFGAALVELALANFPGFYGLSLPGAGSSYGTFWPGLVAQDAIEHRVSLPDDTVEVIAPPAVTADAIADPGADAMPDGAVELPGSSDDTVALGAFVDARSGDKGGDANVGLWVRDPGDWPWLRALMTVERFRALVPDAADLDVARYELANVGAVNFVVHDLLGDGATANTRVDSQAKALGEFIRARHVPAPRR